MLHLEKLITNAKLGVKVMESQYVRMIHTAYRLLGHHVQLAQAHLEQITNYGMTMI